MCCSTEYIGPVHAAVNGTPMNREAAFMATPARSPEAWSELGFWAGILQTRRLWPGQFRAIGSRLAFLAGLGGDDRTTYILARRSLRLSESYTDPPA